MRGQGLLSKKVKPLGIGYLERFVADYEQRMGTHVLPNIASTGKKVAVVGVDRPDSPWPVI